MAGSLDTRVRLTYAPPVKRRLRDLLLGLAILALLVTTSNVLTLCVHGDDAGVQARWDECCVTAPCCKRAAHTESRGQTVRGHTPDCVDYAIALTFEWVSGDAQGAPSSPLAAAIQSLAYASYGTPSWSPRVSAPSRAPPPDRSLRTVILRC